MSPNPQPPYRRLSTADRLRLGVWIAMASMSLFFLALTYAELQRTATWPEWRTPRLLAILTANTLLLLASSLALLRGRQFLTAGQIRPALRWLGTALGMGVAFLAGQAVAWRLLFHAGAYLSHNPDSGFFYLATAGHAVHLLVGLILLAWIFSRAWRGKLPSDRPYLYDLASIVWHCLDATWLYLYLTLLLWRH